MSKSRLDSIKANIANFSAEDIHNDEGLTVREEIEATMALDEYSQSSEGKYASIDDSISNLSEYEVSDEATQKMALLESTASDLTTTASSATNVARGLAGMNEATGAKKSMQDIKSASAQQIYGIQQLGGQGALSAATKVGLNEDTANEALIQSNMASKEAAKSNLSSALTSEAGIKVQAAGLQGQALDSMISENDKVYQSQLSNAQTGIQWDISKLSMEQASDAASEANDSKFLGLF